VIVNKSLLWFKERFVIHFLTFFYPVAQINVVKVTFFGELKLGVTPFTDQKAFKVGAVGVIHARARVATIEVALVDVEVFVGVTGRLTGTDQVGSA